MKPAEELSELAAGFVNRTKQHVFLTGKAGTGKTTFLRHLAETTHKRFVIVAPTGIAALNAKGVTIHSLFLLPPGTLIPDNTPSGEFGDNQNICTRSTLARKHPMNAARRQILRDIDLLIIDEVSMLRADLLDAIDYRLRSVRRNFSQPFGGVQLLMIGDLYQLPPVVRDLERSNLNRYYKSAHFFEAKALQETGYVYIELDKIYRQHDDTFIRLLNNLRNNCPTREDIDLLNSTFRSEAEIRDAGEIITLTTHNYRADEINTRALEELSGPPMTFHAEIDGEFPEGMHPVSERITLKVGAQIMFVKNDQGGRYFNGKLATVKRIDSSLDLIEVELAGDHAMLQIERESWENKKYTVNASTKELDEEVIGTFSQFPVRLAWAITVHKSQGLTFDKAIIDVGQAFAPGQVYVALSRLRSLEGLILRTRLDPSVIATDPRVIEFTSQQPDTSTLPQILQSGQSDFLRDILWQAFEFRDLIQEASLIRRNHASDETSLGDESMKGAVERIQHIFEGELSNLEKFRSQLSGLLRSGERASLLERIQKGAQYYDTLLRAQMKELITYTELIRRRSRTKTLVNDLEEFDLLLTRKRERIGRSQYLATCMLEGVEIEKSRAEDSAQQRDRVALLEYAREVAASSAPLTTKTKSSGKKKTTGIKKAKGSTFDETFQLLHSGLDVQTIANRRGLSVSTIETHLARGIQTGHVEIRKVMTDEVIAEISHLFEQHGNSSLKSIYAKSEARFSFPQLRMVQAYLQQNEVQG